MLYENMQLSCNIAKFTNPCRLFGGFSYFTAAAVQCSATVYSSAGVGLGLGLMGRMGLAWDGA